MGSTSREKNVWVRLHVEKSSKNPPTFFAICKPVTNDPLPTIENLPSTKSSKYRNSPSLNPNALQYTHINVSLKEFRAGSNESFGKACGMNSGYWFETSCWRNGFEQDMMKKYMQSEYDTTGAHEEENTNMSSALKLSSVIDLKNVINQMSVAEALQPGKRSVFRAAINSMDNLSDEKRRNVLNILTKSETFDSGISVIIESDENNSSTLKKRNSNDIFNTSVSQEELKCDVYFAWLPFLDSIYASIVYVGNDFRTESKTANDVRTLKEKSDKEGQRTLRYVFIILAPSEINRDIAYAISVLFNHVPFANYLCGSSLSNMRRNMLFGLNEFMRNALVLPNIASGIESDTAELIQSNAELQIRRSNSSNYSRCIANALSQQLLIDDSVLPTKTKTRKDSDCSVLKDTIVVKTQAGPNWLFDQVIQKRAIGHTNENLDWLIGSENRIVLLRSILLFILCALIITIPVIWETGTSKTNDGTHAAPLMNYVGVVGGGLHTIAAGVPIILPINKGRGGNSPGMILMRSFFQKIPTDGTDVTFHWKLLENDIPISDAMGDFVIKNTSNKEIEWEKWLDLKGFEYKSSNSMTIQLTSNSTTSLAFFFEAQFVPAIARYRILISAFIIFVVYGIISAEIMNRTLVAAIGAFFSLALLTGITGPPPMKEVVSWMNESTLGLLFGMMILIHFLSETGVFQWFAVRAYKISAGSNMRLLIYLNAATAIFSAFLDNTTTALLVGPVTVQLCELIEVDPVPFLMSEAMFSNIGGTATLIGSVPNIIIGSELPHVMGFIDFVTHLCPAVLIMSPFVTLLHKSYFRNSLSGGKVVNADQLMARYKIHNKPLLLNTCMVTTSVVIVFFLHPFHHTDSAWIAIVGGLVMLIAASPRQIHHALQQIEWDTLLFFASLFTMIAATIPDDFFSEIFFHGTCEVGFIRFIAERIASMIESVPESSQLTVGIVLILWISGIVSSVLANIPYTATMVPIVNLMADELKLDKQILVIALAFGACLGGCGTVVGASANLILAGVAETHGYHIGFLQFMKIGVPTVLLCVTIATIYMYVRYILIGM